MKHVQKAGGIVINTDGDILVITNDLGRHTLPKGTPEPGEQLIDTARREIEEESGLTELAIHHELGILVRPGYSDDNKITPSVIKHILFFYCTTKEMKLLPKTPEILNAEWVNPNDIAMVLSWPEEIKFVETHRAKLGL